MGILHNVEFGTIVYVTIWTHLSWKSNNLQTDHNILDEYRFNVWMINIIQIKIPVLGCKA